MGGPGLDSDGPPLLFEPWLDAAPLRLTVGDSLRPRWRSEVTLFPSGRFLCYNAIMRLFLVPCPGCGVQPTVIHNAARYGIQCQMNSCAVKQRVSPCHPTEQFAATAWNVLTKNWANSAYPPPAEFAKALKTHNINRQKVDIAKEIGISIDCLNRAQNKHRLRVETVCRIHRWLGLEPPVTYEHYCVPLPNRGSGAITIPYNDRMGTAEPRTHEGLTVPFIA